MKPAKPEVVVITGASAGIGRATAQAFAKEGDGACFFSLEDAQRQIFL